MSRQLRADENFGAALWQIDGIQILKETQAVKIKLGYCGRILSFVDYALSVVKYLARSQLIRLR